MYPEEFYEYEYLLEGLDEELVMTILGVVGGILLVIGLFALVGYVLQSLGL